MTLLMWIPPACALKNRRWLKIILAYHIVLNILWLLVSCVFFFGLYQSELYIIFPKVFTLLLASYNVLQTCYTWHFVYRIFSHQRKVRLCDILENAREDYVWPAKYTMLLAILPVCVCVQIALITFVEVQLWSGEVVEDMFSFLVENSLLNIYIIVFILLRIYHFIGYFMYTPFVACLCLTIKTHLDICFVSLSSQDEPEIEFLKAKLCQIVKFIYQVNSQFEIHNSLYLIVASSFTMIWLYLGIIFHECYSNWIFAQIGCFVTSLASFIWIASTIHTQVRRATHL